MSQEIDSKNNKSEKQAPESHGKSDGLSSLYLELMKSAQEVSSHAIQSSSDKAGKFTNEPKTNDLSLSTNSLYLSSLKVFGSSRLISTTHDRYEHKGDKIHPHGPKDAVENKTFEWGGKELRLRTRDGIPEYFKDADGNEWNSNDGNGWSKKDGLRSETFQAKISFDENTVELSLEKPFGSRTVFRNDGSLITSFSSSDGQQVSISKDAAGKQILHDGEKTWESSDGKNWKSGAEHREGQYQIEENGRLIFTDALGKERVEKQSETAQAINEKMDDLEKRFNIKMGRPGDKPIYTEDDKQVTFDLRLPTMDELKVTEDVLKKFAHVAKKNGTDFEGLRLNFAASKGNALGFDEHGWHDEAKDGKPPSIGIAPRDFAQTRGYDGMEGTLLHEFTHQLQELEWIDRRHREKVPRDIERFFGFDKVMPPVTKDEEGTYRLTDSQGKKWQYENSQGKVDDDASWYPVDKDKVVHDDARAIDDKQMRQKLAPERRPATDYFFNPAETHAEAISMYLFERKMLHDTNSALYESVKKWDQRDINYRYGFNTREDGQIVAKMIRSADGHVVPNTSENRRAVRELEDSFASSAVAKVPPLISGHRCSRC